MFQEVSVCACHEHPGRESVQCHGLASQQEAALSHWGSRQCTIVPEGKPVLGQVENYVMVLYLLFTIPGINL